MQLSAQPFLDRSNNTIKSFVHLLARQCPLISAEGEMKSEITLPFSFKDVE